MPSRKRPFQAVDDCSEAASHDDCWGLNRIRKMWQFANLCQWIYIFGKAAKMDESLGIEASNLLTYLLLEVPLVNIVQEIEADCLKPDAPLLADLALAILKLVSSQRGLTHDILDDQLRKQYLTKGCESNPLGSASSPRKFADLDVVAKIKVLQQLTQWTMIHPERLRDRMEEHKDMEQTTWRIEPYGWDREDRTYYVLDDNRVYRLTEAPPTQIQPKSKGKTGRSGRRSSKRQRLASSKRNSEGDSPGDERNSEPVDNGIGGRNWECLAVTLQDVRVLLMGLDKTRDENEKTLRRQLITHLVPILEKQEESQKRKQLQKERELANLAKMATAKRSSRIASKVERQKQEDKVKEEEVQLKAAEVSKRREEEDRLKMEKDRDFRTHSRQRRLQEREARRLQHEQLAQQLSEDSKSASTTSGRISERRRKAEIERNREALKELSQEAEEWVFDCTCGLFGQVDDGTHSVSCESCNVWQHSKCVGISEEEADRQDFHFQCEPCRRRNEASSGTGKETTERHLDAFKCSVATSPATEQLVAGQRTTSPKAADSPSKERNEKPRSRDAASLSADADLCSALKSRQKARPSPAPPHALASNPGARSAPAILSRPSDEDSMAVKSATGVEEDDASSAALVRHTQATAPRPGEGLSIDGNLAQASSTSPSTDVAGVR